MAQSNEALLRDRVLQAVVGHVGNGRLYRRQTKGVWEREIAVSLKTGWDARVDARRVLNALINVNSYMRSLEPSNLDPRHNFLLSSLPVEIILVIACAIPPLDLFHFCFACKQLLQTVVEALASGNPHSQLEIELLNAAACTRVQCAPFVHELDAALCIANYIRLERVHRFGVRPELRACLLAIQASHVSGGVAAELSVRAGTSNPFSTSSQSDFIVTFAPSGLVSIAVDRSHSFLCVAIDFGDSAKCIAVCRPSILRPDINVRWSTAELSTSMYLQKQRKYTVASVR